MTTAGNYNMITVLGHTAAGKTAIAAGIAARLGGEVISADSRQVYRRMDLGTGKDYGDYFVDGVQVPSHLLDICDPGYHYNVFEFRRDFSSTFTAIRSRGNLPVLCGGSGLYLEAILRDYRMADVPVNEELRAEFAGKSMEELTRILAGLRELHNTTDTVNRKRVERAIEIAWYERDHPEDRLVLPELRPLITGVSFNRELRRERITSRLRQRLEEGMVEEVKALLDSGLSPAQLDYYGLEYRYITLYLSGELGYEAMFSALNTAIHRFAKRQLTYFRGMERRGIPVKWLDEALTEEEKIRQVIDWFRST
ncbi:MAG: tRNA (adenosine(37)-N6)-dimethylallyltransferase MiaA [Bacteroidota bacterium]